LISEGILRFPCCLQDAGVLIPQVFLRVPVLRVAANARLAMQYTAELYNDQMMMSGRMMC
jgi:hypothetical protein